MKKQIAVAYNGTMTSVGDFKVSRLIPNRYVSAVGPFIFLDHLVPLSHPAKPAHAPNGDFAHPHRGIITFTYLFNGEMEHFDSRGNHGIVGSGGAQWMKAGNGIIHDENPSEAFQSQGGKLHGLQFWINLPSSEKAQAPEYLAVKSEDFPVISLPGNKGFLKVLIGEFKGEVSPIKTFSKQYNYHLHLDPNASFTLLVDTAFETGALVSSGELSVNGSVHNSGEVLVFGIDGTEITIENKSNAPADVILFGGETYTEPIVAHGPFVMNNEQEIALAYRDFHNGLYGSISYEKTLDR